VEEEHILEEEEKRSQPALGTVLVEEKMILEEKIIKGEEDIAGGEEDKLDFLMEFRKMLGGS